MVAGVNGAGKTTSIGKLAKWLQQQGHTVLLAAGDTFRAAAREQLAVWGERNGVAVIQQAGGDAAAVAFDAVAAAKARGVDVVIADTAGRLPTQLHLMEELAKVRRVLGKASPGAPHATWLVLDANTGQNALSQVTSFDKAVPLTGLIVTKLDGSAKGGIVAAIAREHPVPIAFIGVGEQLDDLRPFAARDYAEALLPDEAASGPGSRVGGGSRPGPVRLKSDPHPRLSSLDGSSPPLGSGFSPTGRHRTDRSWPVLGEDRIGQNAVQVLVRGGESG